MYHLDERICSEFYEKCFFVDLIDAVLCNFRDSVVWFPPFL